MNEIWKDINNYEGLYQVSNYGKVKSIDRKVPHKRGFLLTLKGRMLKPSTHTDGYLQVVLNNQCVKTVKVHRLVGEAFVNKPNKLCEINHKDYDKTNNKSTNLEWVSKSENCIHRERKKRR